MEQTELQRVRPGCAFVRTFPCSGCRARFSFAPATRELKCEHCSATNAIAADDARMKELDFETHLKALEGKMEVQQVEESAARSS